MTSPQNSKSAAMTGPDDFARTAQAQAEQLWATQTRFFSIYGDFMKHWVERRQQAAKAAVEVAQKALHSGGQPVNMPALCGEWLSGSMQRMAADLQEYQECSSQAAAMLGSTLPQWPGLATARPKQARPATRD